MLYDHDQSNNLAIVIQVCSDIINYYAITDDKKDRV